MLVANPFIMLVLSWRGSFDLWKPYHINTLLNGFNINIYKHAIGKLWSIFSF
jgi:hypothetical protein